MDEGMMYRYILFGGTTEGRVLAGILAERNVPSAVFVATEYGEQALESVESSGIGGNLDVFAGRIDERQMQDLFEEHTPETVIDATHPYAAVVSGNIRRAAAAAGVRYVRVLRPSTIADTRLSAFVGSPGSSSSSDSSTTHGSSESAVSSEQIRFFQTVEDMVAWLNTNEDRVFSTLGAKDLPALAKVSGFEKRVFVRILPTVEGISACNELGFPMKHILGLHGPFSEEYNAAQYLATGADIVITKDTGKPGGFDQKVNAALKSGLKVAILKRPADEEHFIRLEEMIQILKKE